MAARHRDFSMKASVTKSSFGKLRSGKSVDLYTLTNKNGAIAKVTNYGTIITELHVPDKKGRLGDVVLGFDTLDQYLKGHPYFGCTVGRVANRIANGRFTLDEKPYKLAINSGANCIHGGLRGFDKNLWKATPQEGASVKFNYTSADAEEGFPGKLDVTVTMTLSDRNELVLEYLAAANQPTPVNLTNHSYFNLAGEGDIKNHKLILASDYFTPLNSDSIPTGEIKSVTRTPMDFTRPVPVGARFASLGGKPQGYDHNFILRNGGRSLMLAARLTDPKSGRIMEVLTTEPAIQLYTGNSLDGSITGKGGMVYHAHTGLCLEAQHYPDSVNHPHFPNTILRPGETYRQTTIHRFLAA
jgi:aldose 1-epimerase